MADIRYTLEHSGDYIADVLEKAVGLTGKAAGATWSATKSVAKKLPAIHVSWSDFSGGSIKGALSSATGFTWSMTKNVSGLARGSARGVILTYDINRLRKEKRALTRQLAERFLKVYAETSRADLSYDADAAPILARLAEIEKIMTEFVEERSERLYPKAAAPVETPAQALIPELIVPGPEAIVSDEDATTFVAQEVAEESHAEEAASEESHAEESHTEESHTEESHAEESHAEESSASDAIAPEEHRADTESQEQTNETEPTSGLI
jgi:hypothetical protein